MTDVIRRAAKLLSEAKQIKTIDLDTLMKEWQSGRSYGGVLKNAGKPKWTRHSENDWTVEVTYRKGENLGYYTHEMSPTEWMVSGIDHMRQDIGNWYNETPEKTLNSKGRSYEPCERLGGKNVSVDTKTTSNEFNQTTVIRIHIV